MGTTIETNEPETLEELTDDGILILTLNRPAQMNALSHGLQQGILAAVKRAKHDNDVKVIVVTGAGRGFCAGADVSDGGPAGNAAKQPGRAQIAEKRGPTDIVTALANSDVPLIGAINGPAVGAGFGLSLCLDVRIASDKARMGSIFIKRGVGPDWGVSYWLPKIVGIPRAYEILYSGELLDAKSAQEEGLVSRVVPHDQLMEEALNYARMIANGPPIAYTYTRRALMHSIHNNLDEHMVFEWTQQLELLQTEDAKEGFKAFLEKREPKFDGH